MFSRIIDNLISNACKYNKKDGKVVIIINNNNIKIIDTGIGIKDTKKVFKRLYTEQQSGLGIGLNIVKKFIMELDLKIEINSILGKGTEIIILY